MHGELIVHVIDCTTFIVLTIYCDSANGSIWLTMPVACTTRGGGGGVVKLLLKVGVTEARFKHAHFMQQYTE